MKSKILKKNGYVYEVVGSKKGFETWFNAGKDPDDPRWKPKAKPVDEVVEQPKPKKKKVEIVENVEEEKEPVE